MKPIDKSPNIFQSTLPARGATYYCPLHSACPSYFNPRSPHGERRQGLAGGGVLHLISIHAPRTGSDKTMRGIAGSVHHFNPRSPHGERRLEFVAVHPQPEFQSTLPARGATVLRLDVLRLNGISIHAPRTGSDSIVVDYYGREKISIHAPRTGSDRRGFKSSQTTEYFNPRSPHGERRRSRRRNVYGHLISIHAPRTGSD